MRAATVRRVAPLAAAALVLGVIGGVWLVLRLGDPGGPLLVGPGGPGGDPPVLRLTTWLAPASGPVDPRFHLAPGADLPDGPGSAPVRRLDDAADVTAAATRTGSPVPAGWLPRSSTGPDYPLVTARGAYEHLRHSPMPMTAMACPAPPPGQSVPMSCGGPVTVTGARLGLSVQQDSDGVLLVPSWLFDVTGSAQPLVQLAVQPRLLRAAPGAPGGSGGGLPGVSGTAQPVPPGPPSRFSSVTRGSDDRSLQVTFWGGVPECYSYAVRAVEDHQAVRLRVTETRDPGNRVCIDLAVEVKRTVHLEAPLGLRLVLDAVTGEVLLGPTR